MTSPLITPVILSGGSGTRLWPMSTAARPKQFLPLVDENSMFRATLDRAGDRSLFTAPVIVCGTGHVPHVETDLTAAGVTDATIVVEPAARNTAPAIALAALAAPTPDALLLVMPSDHAMRDPESFRAAVARALPAVRDGALATFGITPSGPETGYGYIALGAGLPGNDGVYAVDRFVEKPDIDRARAMLDAGGHLWNAGIFLLRADALLAALGVHAPAIAAACDAAMAASSRDGQQVHPDAAEFAASPSDSIDYAVMEKADRVVVVPTDPGWSDVGGWPALHMLAERDESGNAVRGDVIALDSKGSLIRAAPGVRIATLGVENLVIVATGDDVLILPMDRAQEIRRIVDALGKP